ncbi:MAG: dihydrolipoyl dehydrogenase [Chloroflexi bacterium]|nr:dihydrolipoyl dehydrogenase [Chloroflexota bacterium]MCH8876857.1 dihydrolipoyl dehydrogenase [Chloroflexota bacterium]MCI0773469.1 dihydrolipoyl dehydrogenase [Chloroflexota bacterium]MCI0807232.1 dihydrolipoyl dehydrogenase [Chloroflexota bacterium]MCI0828062.1 dihydrolipoyl dehydrogenase [Chloroflexota bacterium]
MPDYDVVVIGAGPGGYVCAIRAAQLGLKTAIVDREWLGGVCLNVGCIPSKALLKNAELAHVLRERGEYFGFSVEGLKLDYGRAVERSREVADRLVKGVGFLMKKNNIEVHMGAAILRSPNSIAVTNSEGEGVELGAKNIVVATGASAASIPGLEIDGQRVLTYREAILQTQAPKSVLIVGSGAVGLEFATIWNGYGVEVTIVEMLPRIAPLEDEDVSKELAKEFRRRGIKIMVGTKVDNIEVLKTKVKATVVGDSGKEILEAEQALVATGFRPNTAGFGLEDLGVQLAESGMVEIDERMGTNVPGIWAIGDVTGKLQLAHVAMAMGIVCAENIAGVETIELNYEMMPRATYSSPQVASFGMTEAQAEQRGYEIRVGRFPFQASGKSLGMGETAGWIKLISDARYGEILGAHLIGPEVTELLPELTLAQGMELTFTEIARNVHAHPTLSEAIMEAAHDAEGQAIHI